MKNIDSNKSKAIALNLLDQLNKHYEQNTNDAVADKIYNLVNEELWGHEVEDKYAYDQKIRPIIGIAAVAISLFVGANIYQFVDQYSLASGIFVGALTLGVIAHFIPEHFINKTQAKKSPYRFYREIRKVREMYADQNDAEKKENALISKYSIEPETKK